ncbi:hypothetical protein OG978_01770 [Streptomyces sp. NBC_01591]|uniref:hypothetical protein n=1 Tax=Streptomyces sp. NBC_01591 TaxID=2975888 RepID=UPI002DDC2B50|nr:hypothetical protein [Streptomyces sp. NBC_01591]WSD66266.1 hypothetical protein OG978_01770 [Streptomyces sp. NBC_01591]
MALDDYAIQSLSLSGLLNRVVYPLVRREAHDPQQGLLLVLGAAGRKLLEDRIAHERWENDYRRFVLCEPSTNEETPTGLCPAPASAHRAQGT